MTAGSCIEDRFPIYTVFERLWTNRMKIYLLQHSHEIEIGAGVKADETKVIGIYSSYENAERVKNRFKVKQGFNRFSEDCFYIDEYELDQDHWTEGFVTWDSADNKWIE